jgi:putative membrane protein
LTAERYPTALLALWVLALAVSAIGPYDRLTWFMEVAPVIVAIPLLVATRRRFPLTPLLYALIFAHGLILILGGHYTYARVPLGFWIQDAFDFARNHYDRIGHFAQGFIPAVLAREILLRRTALRPGKMLFYLVVSVALAFSAFYELIEWWAAVALDQDAEQFLATQGDVWDSQWDMFMAMLGAIVALVTLSGVHDGQLGSLNRPQD